MPFAILLSTLRKWHIVQCSCPAAGVTVFNFSGKALATGSKSQKYVPTNLHLPLGIYLEGISEIGIRIYVQGHSLLF